MNSTSKREPADRMVSILSLQVKSGNSLPTTSRESVVRWFGVSVACASHAHTSRDFFGSSFHCADLTSVLKGVSTPACVSSHSSHFSSRELNLSKPVSCAVRNQVCSNDAEAKSGAPCSESSGNVEGVMYRPLWSRFFLPGVALCDGRVGRDCLD